MKAKLYSSSGKLVKETSLSQDLFGRVVKPQVMAQVIRVLSSRVHSGTALAKTRGEVNRTTAKVYAQEHTGRARHGARSAPIYVGGGVAHGPKGLAGTPLKLTRKLSRLGVLGAFNYLATKQMIGLVEALEETKPQSKKIVQLVKAIGQEKVLLLTGKSYPSLQQAANNVSHLTLMPATAVNTLQLLKAKYLLIDQAALPQLETRLLGTPAKVEVKKKVAKKVTESV